MKYIDIKNTELNEPLYFLIGDAEICEMAKKEIIAKLHLDDMSISVFDDENFDVNLLVSAANQFSFFDDKRLVIIKNLSKELNKSEQEVLTNYLKNPNSSAIILIFNQGVANFDFIKNKEIIECRADDGFVYSYIKEEFNKSSKEISSTCIKKIAKYCLNNIARIKLEIKKICDYSLDKSEITESMIDLLITPDIEMRVFDLTDFLANKNIIGANRVLHDMLNSGESPIKTLGLIAAHFRRLFFAKINSSYPISELASALNCKDFAVTKAKQQSSKFGANQLKNIENLILDVDYSVKSGGMSQENGLYYLIYKVVTM